MKQADDTTRVLIPLTLRRRNGRPVIVASDLEADPRYRIQAPHILKALGRAWAWRRRLETGEVATIQDLASSEGVTDRFVSRILRLAYLSPEVLERLVISRDAPSISLDQLAEATRLPWARQVEFVFPRS